MTSVVCMVAEDVSVKMWVSFPGRFKEARELLAP